MWRGVLLGFVVAGVLAGCSLGGGSGGGTNGGVRITQGGLVAKVKAANYGVKTRCSRHSEDGSRWACAVGDGMDPECYVIDVDANGSWKIDQRATVCRYP
jgi:hypothetical protein